MIDYIESGRTEGARVLTGGKKWAQSEGGFWVEPTVLVDAKAEMRVVKEEVRSSLVDLTADIWTSGRCSSV